MQPDLFWCQSTAPKLKPKQNQGCKGGTKGTVEKPAAHQNGFPLSYLRAPWSRQRGARKHSWFLW